jgi:hypothetical protein
MNPLEPSWTNSAVKVELETKHSVACLIRVDVGRMGLNSASMTLIA